ncbi:hypothetical protein NDU88_005589 [Pleurodeles waltl]|uniref:Uncharacterized protein n=1 Tax=Pleurodeles waltl TaxID=8319 RepID=A0AAV7WZY9_PLEWA|nr:hypothetical protein NDU88_005589 [Pleurodeles waltl]
MSALWLVPLGHRRTVRSAPGADAGTGFGVNTATAGAGRKFLPVRHKEGAVSLQPGGLSGGVAAQGVNGVSLCHPLGLAAPQDHGQPTPSGIRHGETQGGFPSRLGATGHRS